MSTACCTRRSSRASWRRRSFAGLRAGRGGRRSAPGDGGGARGDRRRGALAEAAARYGYVRPVVDDGDAIVIRDGRHPVVERVLPEGASCRTTSSSSTAEAQIVVLTGPNMAGKSTYLRTGRADRADGAGGLVRAGAGGADRRRRPADHARRRAGRHRGRAFDLHGRDAGDGGDPARATGRSLLIFDEIGRGTSTYDGLAIARAVVEYLHNRPDARARTLFATHYHELTQLAETLPRVRNFNVAVAEEDGGVVFLHRILPGGADRSYGVHVGQLAGLPRAVTARAQELLGELEAVVARDGAAGGRDAGAVTAVHTGGGSSAQRARGARRQRNDAAGGAAAAVRAVGAGAARRLTRTVIGRGCSRSERGLQQLSTVHCSLTTTHILVPLAPSDSDGAAVRSLGEVLCRSVSWRPKSPPASPPGRSSSARRRW